jgi:Mrp family chromosome partitioning ATPase
VLLTAPSGGEGVTTIAASLAAALAEDGRTRVLLVDANLRAPAVHERFDVARAPGLIDWDGATPPRYQGVDGTPNLFLLTAGTPAPPESVASLPAGLLGTLAKTTRDHFDFVIWDAAPVVRYPDSLPLASLTDGVIVVIEAGATRVEQLELTRERLQRAGARVLGSVMNRTGRNLFRWLKDSDEG